MRTEINGLGGFPSIESCSLALLICLSVSKTALLHCPQYLGWTAAAMATPLLMGITGTGFFLMSLAANQVAT